MVGTVCGRLFFYRQGARQDVVGAQIFQKTLVGATHSIFERTCSKIRSKTLDLECLVLVLGLLAWKTLTLRCLPSLIKVDYLI